MKIAVVYLAKTDEVVAFDFDETKNPYFEFSRILDVDLVEIVRNKKMKDMTLDKETGMYLCMAVDETGLWNENPIENNLGSYLYEGIIVGDIILTKYKEDGEFSTPVGFDSLEEANEWLAKIK